MGGEAEHVVLVLLLVPHAVVADARHHVLASAGLSGGGDGILDRAVAQPAGVAPVQPASPRVIQLVKRCHNGVLVPTRPLRIVEIEVVTTETRVVGEDDSYK